MTRLDTLEHRLDIMARDLDDTRNALGSHQDAIGKLAQLVPAIQTLASELGHLIHVTGVPTPETLAAGRLPGGPETLAGQVIKIQASLEEIAALFAKQDAKIRVMIEAGKSPQAWSPSRLQRELEAAQAAAVASVRQAQEAARQQVEHLMSQVGTERPPVRLNGVPVELALTKEEEPAGE